MNPTNMTRREDYTDLIKRLRGKYSLGNDGMIREDRDFGNYTPKITKDAADVIENLLSELDSIHTQYAQLNEKYFTLLAWANDLHEWVLSLVEKSEKVLHNFEPYTRMAKSVHTIISEQQEWASKPRELSLDELKAKILSCAVSQVESELRENELVSSAAVIELFKAYALRNNKGDSNER